ncbi:MAG: MFS transporter [Alphaproteobacteria bacterium]|nr:MFS transporter [Alphaproteobacteria bacterium]
MNDSSHRSSAGAYVAFRLIVSLVLMTVGTVGMYVGIVGLKPIAAEFGISRGVGSLPYALFMLGYGFGNVLHGRLADRYGILVPLLIGSLALPAGLILSAQTGSLWQFLAAIALLAGMLGSSAVFAPIVADVSLWFTGRRGLAVGFVLSGSYFAGAVWPPVLQYLIGEYGWRSAFTTVGYFCLATMVPMSFLLYRKPGHLAAAEEEPRDSHFARPLGLAPNALQCGICLAGIGCCMAMAMPQVHIVAHATDLGFSAQRGAEMLSLMLGFGIISRLVSGWISDRIGGLRVLLIGSGLQGVMLAIFLTADSLTALYIVSACFGLSQGGIVPSYAIIVATFFPSAQAGWRIGVVLFSTLVGMGVGGWLAGLLYDLTGSYDLAFLNAVAFNLGNTAIAVSLLRRARRLALA